MLQGAMVKSEGSSPHRRKSVSKESVSKATSELNNLLQIISGTSAEIGNLWEGCEGSEQYLNMLRSSIDRAEAVAAQLAEQAGGANQKVLMHPELASFLKPKTISEMPRAKPNHPRRRRRTDGPGFNQATTERSRLPSRDRAIGV